MASTTGGELKATPHTVAAPKWWIDCHILASNLTGEDKKYLQAALVSTNKRNYRFRPDERVIALLKALEAKTPRCIHFAEGAN